MVCYGKGPMVTGRLVLAALLLSLAASGCSTVRELTGLISPGEPSVNLKSAEIRWLLIKNPRFGDIPSEPEYIWVEEDKVPTTFKTVFMGKRSIIAPPEIVAKYGAPPGGGKISPRQAMPTPAPGIQDASRPTPNPAASVERGAGAAAPGPAASAGSAAPAASTPAAPPPPEAKRGYVVYVDTTRIAIDLTAADGVQAGTVVSLRRDRIPVIHPVTGEILGELDEEVGTARITETRERFSVAEIQTVTPGSQIQIRDRVVLK